MVARALCGCGLDLGDESELLGPTEHNDHGHDVAEAYVALCAEAGPVFHDALGDEPFFPPADSLLRMQPAAKAAAVRRPRGG